MSVAITSASGNSQRQRDGQTAAARADVDDEPRLPVRRGGDRLLDDELGFRPGDQDVGRDFEVEPPELAMAGDVRDRLARGAPADERAS